MGYKDDVKADVPDDVKEALALCDKILNRIGDLPEVAFDFGASVEDKVGGMREWIESNGRVTEKMKAALENMYSGILKWVHEDD